MMKVFINGEAHMFNNPVSISTLVDSLELDQKKIAIEHNQAIVPRSDYATTFIQDNDSLEIVHFIGGG